MKYLPLKACPLVFELELGSSFTDCVISVGGTRFPASGNTDSSQVIWLAWTTNFTNAMLLASSIQKSFQPHVLLTFVNVIKFLMVRHFLLLLFVRDPNLCII